MAAKRQREIIAAIVREAEQAAGAVEPRCRHFGDCGGCDIQHLTYDAQLHVKRQLVEAALREVPETSDCRVLDPVPASAQWRYRNKIEFTFDQRDDGGLILGFSPKNKWWRRIDIEECHLCSERMLATTLAVKDWARRSGLPAYHQRRKEGFLRNLVLRESAATGDYLVNLVTNEGPFPAKEFAEVVGAFHPTGVMRTIQSRPTAAVVFEQVEVLAGDPALRECIAGLTFRLAPDAFFQTNSAMAQRLVALVAEAAAPTGGERLLDMFCGVGTMGLALAHRAKEIIGVESVEPAIVAARENAAANDIRNAEFVCATARAYLREHAGEHCDILILDPPRPGCGARVVRRLREMRPPRIVYVSCNPQALAVDLALFSDAYDIGPIQPVDLFPQTLHVEAVVAMTARSPQGLH
ncbi:MAG: 23S rRNA (uracil(1939)-C(5))-methyltransferase RlmD [Armatimonadota bacterium]|nr:MAG: 23S rRNA (uracil(1939)-C(5))-methyltransferase RlmD [Armatimonadota bacterium]